tara:strand:- start:31500 stop:32573 length:1074 start_codon:yes stop_codon:yes gene_type:complete
MKKLILNNTHELLGAKMIDFGGFYMPVQYEGVKAEHHAVRNKVGVFDVSHMGEIFVTGEESLDFLQYVTSNDISKLSEGKVQYSYLPNNEGGIVDDLLVYQLGKNKYMLVVNASNIEKDYNWLKKNNSFKCEITNKSDEYSLLALQGPESLDLLRKISSSDITKLKYYNFIIGDLGLIKNVLISRTGYTGELGFELYVKNSYLIDLWKLLFKTNIQLKPIGLAARDTLRLEKGFCLYGNEINDTTSPIEAGLTWITKFNKNFIGKDIIFKVLKEGPAKKLVGIQLLDKGIARKDYKVFSTTNQKEIGFVASGTMSPTLNKPIATAFINVEYTNVNSIVEISIRNKKIKSKVVNLPFI